MSSNIDRKWKKGDIILHYGTYQCEAEGCPHAFVGVPGRRFPSPACTADAWVLKNQPHEFYF